jgi:hypothetical protein
LKKNIAISLLTLFLFHSIGHFMLMGGALCQWKYEITEQFLSQRTDSELVVISKNDNIKFLDNGKEIEQNGERFDIVKTVGDTYLCWHDAKETQLVKKLFQTFISKESKKSDVDFSILKNIFKIYFFENQYFTSIKYFLIKIDFEESSPFLFQLLKSFWQPPQL